MDFCEIFFWGKGKVHYIMCHEGREGIEALFVKAYVHLCV